MTHRRRTAPHASRRPPHGGPCARRRGRTKLTCNRLAWRWAATTLGLALILASPALAAGAPDVAAGRAFAEKNCARCHAIGKTGDSPFAPAPPFRTFSKKWPVEYLEEALAEGIGVGHPAMPEFQLTPEEIDDLIAYLKSIQVR